VVAQLRSRTEQLQNSLADLHLSLGSLLSLLGSLIVPSLSLSIASHRLSNCSTTLPMLSICYLMALISCLSVPQRFKRFSDPLLVFQGFPDFITFASNQGGQIELRRKLSRLNRVCDRNFRNSSMGCIRNLLTF